MSMVCGLVSDVGGGGDGNGGGGGDGDGGRVHVGARLFRRGRLGRRRAAHGDWHRGRVDPASDAPERFSNLRVSSLRSEFFSLRSKFSTGAVSNTYVRKSSFQLPTTVFHCVYGHYGFVAAS